MGNAEVRKFMRPLLKRGWSESYLSDGHIIITHVSGQQVKLPGTPSGHSWQKQAKAKIRKIEASA